MGCGSSKSPSEVSNQRRPSGSQIPKSDPNKDIFVGISPQQPLLCRDEFNSKYTNEVMYRWRPAEIVQIDGDSRNKILVHYIGWADTFDLWVDLKAEELKVCPNGLIGAEQIKKGDPLTTDQHRKAMEYFLQGKEFVHVPNGQPQEPEGDQQTSNTAPGENQEPNKTITEANAEEEDENVLSRPLRKLPPPPQPIVPPAPVIATRRAPTSSAPAEASRSSSGSSSPGKMVVPVGAVLPTPLVPPTPLPSILKQPVPPQQAQIQPMGPPAPTPENPYCVKDMVDCLDIFYKKGATVPSQKWRPAEIIEVVGDYVTIHFLNWDSKYDERLHHVNDSHRLSSFGSKTTRAQGSGGSVASASSGTALPRRRSGTGEIASQPHPPPPNVTVVAQLPVKPLKDSDGSEIDSRAAAMGANAGADSTQKTVVKPTGAGPSEAATTTDRAGLTEEQYSFTRNFLNYRKKKLADNQDPDTTAQTASTTSKKALPAEKASEGGFMKQFASLFGAKEAVVAVPTIAASTSGNPSEGGEPGVAVAVAEAVLEGGEDERNEEEIARREHEFLEKLESKGLHVFAIEGDGNCLFRAVSHQLYLQQDRHDELRACCVEHLIRHRKRYEVFCEGDFDDYIREMSKSGTWGDDLEIRALEEITDRVITIYSSSAENVLEPINNNFEEKNLLAGVPPLTLSYHGNSHYNSIYDERYPLPLVQRKSRLLLRSRTALNRQDLLQGSAIGAGDSANGRNSDSASTSDPSAQWRQNGYTNGNGYGQTPSKAANAYGNAHTRTPSYEAANQGAYGGYPRGYPPHQQPHLAYMHPGAHLHPQYQSGGYGTPPSGYGTPPGSYQPPSALLMQAQLQHGLGGAGSHSSDQSDEGDGPSYSAGAMSQDRQQQGYRYQPQPKPVDYGHHGQRSGRVVREAANHGEFLENPTSLRPRPEFVNGSFAIEDDTVLTYSIKVQNVNAVEVLLRCGADPNQTSRKGVAPISGAAHKGNVAIMKMLIEGGAAVNSTNSTGSTALIQAAHFGHLEAVQLLLKYHAASDFANQKGTTALMRASQEGHVEITKCLITSGVDVNRKNHEGMNALMLASQRGHANIVFVLVKAGAAMDEQTAQGSTALMLACKRGHEKCAEVLVSMGAEIFMRDRRMRTARDTAQRRNHINMLCWLDTQVQVMRVQEGRHKQRMQLMAMLRKAHLKNCLRFSDTLTGAFALYNVVKRVMFHRSRSIASNNMMLTNAPEVVADESVLADFTAHSSVLTVAASRQPHESLMRMELQVHLAQSSWAEIAAIPVYRGGVRLAHRHDGYSEWQWPFLLQRCMAMPSGVFELIAEYMPLPRVWQWSLLRLKRRCKLAPHQAVQDLCVIMDEILRDSAIFAGADQTNLLIKINQSPQIHAFLIEKLEMSEPLLDALCAYSSAQGLILHSSEAEVTFKHQYARNMLNTAVELFRWYRNRCNALKLLMLQPHFPVNPASGLAAHQQQRRGDAEVGDEEGDAMESTDVAVEEEEGQEDNEEDVSDFEAEFIAAEPDTENENEMVVDEDGGDALGDSDA